MRDDPCSAYVRAKKNLPNNWRVYQLEAVENFTKVKIIGYLVRPASPEFEPHLMRDFDWIKPLTGKAQLTITNEEYSALFEKEARK